MQSLLFRFRFSVSGRRLCHRLCHGTLSDYRSKSLFKQVFLLSACCLSDTGTPPPSLYALCHKGTYECAPCQHLQVAAGFIFPSKRQELGWTRGLFLLVWSRDTGKSFLRQRNHSWIAKVQQVWARNSSKDVIRLQIYILIYIINMILKKLLNQNAIG